MMSFYSVSILFLFSVCQEGKLIPRRITAFPHSACDRIEKARTRTLKMTLVIGKSI